MDMSRGNLREDGITGRSVYTALPGESRTDVYLSGYEGYVSHEDLYTNTQLTPDAFVSDDVCFRMSNARGEPEVIVARTSRESQPTASAQAVGPHARAVAPLYGERIYSFPMAAYASLSYRRWENLIWAIQKRMLALAPYREVEHITVTANTGPWVNKWEKYAYFAVTTAPFTPFETANMLLKSRSYYQTHHRSLWEHVQTFEEYEQMRLIYDTEETMAICPYVSLYPYEVMVLPKSEISDFSHVSSTTRASLARTLRTVYKAMAHTLSDPAVTMLIQTAPVNGGTYPYFRSHIRLIPHVRVPTAWSRDAFYPVNFVAPEDAARQLRERI